MEISIQQHILPIVVIFVMTTIGMELKVRQFAELLESPTVPIVGTIIHTLSFPLVAVFLTLLIKQLALDVSDGTIIGILLIAACPSGGFSNVLVLIAKANLVLSVALTAISSIASFLTVPLLMGGFAYLITDLDTPISLPVVETLIQLLVLIVLPIGGGMIWRAKSSAFVASNLKRLQKLGQLALYVCVAAIIYETFDTVVAEIEQAIPWSLVLCVLTIGVSYFLSLAAGLNPQDRVTIALEGSIRNLAVALLIAVSVLERPDIAVLPTVYFLAVLVVGISFAKTWHLFLK
ncbi:MAG: hypothetical protein HOL98_00145 [Gammaproteobacteria bacterium]|jgi:bile acid:Na+ symporter, BASS family|nr:hypothetical protein [Gammaproteobacteria bacterium]MBT5201839.1 hypothetical protein [Gammaproteobacteria bacterium]MBT5604253.1 hypothetical protein [Gammaproteobacteria bacterium]MBT6245046.1 hypothetical protein [Gammaproteobacteria bacterium]